MPPLVPAGQRLRRAVLATTLLVLGLGAHASSGKGTPRYDDLACQACNAIADRLALMPKGAAFLSSYEPRPDAADFPNELRDVAFVYDNALAAIALVACDRAAAARPIADAFLKALDDDRHYHDGRLRNAYAAGPVTAAGEPIALPGYWHEGDKAWREDPYQVGSATGNAAWAALALLTVHEATGDDRYLDGARRVMMWVNTLTRDEHKPGGYRGGYYGHEPVPRRIAWKSTEHNIDVYAADRWLAQRTGEAVWQDHAARARRFVEAMWRDDGDRFLIGTMSDGVTPNTAVSGLDARLWPLLLMLAPVGREADLLDRALADHGAGGGVDFDTDRDGVWLEGTAQAVLVMRAQHRDAAAARFLETIADQRVGDGLIFASTVDGLTTGLNVGPDADSGDFVYFRLPHIGATAWVALAVSGWNPFLGEFLDGRTNGGATCHLKS